MLEGAFYGLDLLKLHSVTTKLVGRMDKLEEVRKVLGFCILFIFIFIFFRFYLLILERA